MDHTPQTYATVGDLALTLDVFKPTSTSCETAVILLHGGGWRVGDRSRMHPYARRLAGHGFTALATQYRLLGQAPWPAQLEDVIAAVTWVRSQAADLGVRAERIVLEGFSAGAHLALMAGGKVNAAAVVAFFPPTRLSVQPAAAETDAKMLLGPDAEPAAADAASPMAQVEPGYPPTFFLHGGADWMVSPEASRGMYERLLTAGVSAELHVFAGQHHEFSAQTSMVDPVQDEVAAFLRRVVVEPQTFSEEALRENPFAKGPEALAAARRG